jgi:ubiquinone/menaquinone biosynthesis C-methylase UbiE
MSENSGLARDVRAFWNNRAGLGQWAGSRDVIAKQLEINAISQHVKDGMRVLEVGCGNGITAIELARLYDIELVGIDYAEEMVSSARTMLSNQPIKGSVSFEVGDVQSLSGFSRKFDLIYTERVLINLPDWSSQKQAIMTIADLLSDGGSYVMCENSQDGLDKINELRERVNLSSITPPWHNRYFRDTELKETIFPGIKLEGVIFYSSTYYFLSRVINAWLAAQEGSEPDYDSPINQLALQLPPVGELGQGRIWLWRKMNDNLACQSKDQPV